MKYNFLLILIAFWIFSEKSVAQSVLDNNPGSTQWNAINTPNFEVIFQEGFDREAMRLANTLQYLYEPVSESMSTHPKDISVILQNQNSISNGFVTLGPRRSEFFTTPPQDYNFLGTNDWLDLLAVHEFRHVVQFDKSRKGVTKLASIIWGQNAQSGLAFLSVPIWFWEGDAVVIETTHTPSGRGRIPNFNLAMRAQNLEEKPFNYHKQYLGSFKDFVPSHYVIGYYMTTYLRREYDENIWDKITDRAFKNSIVPFTFSNSIKKYTGKRVVPTYNEMTEDINQNWEEQLEKVEVSEYENVEHKKKKVFTNYLYPNPLPDGSVIALKAGLSDFSRFVRIYPSGKEKRVFVPGPFNDPGFLSSTNHKIVWSEFQFDPRWRQKTYSVIKVHNLETGLTKRITTKSRLTGPALSPDGSQIVAVNNNTDGTFELVVINSITGTIVNHIAAEAGTFYSMPGWSADGTKVAVLKHKKGKSVISIDPINGDKEVLIEASDENIGHPVLTDQHLFYNSPYSGIDNIYALDLNTGKKYQVTSARYGAYNPRISEDQRWIYYNDFDSKGYNIVKIPYRSSDWKPIDSVVPNPVNYYKPVLEQENQENILDSVPSFRYPVQRYSKTKKLFNIHSWGPYFTTSVTDINLGVYTQDILSQSRGFAGYSYDAAQETGRWVLDYSYQNLLPIIDVEGYLGNRKTSTTIRDTSNVVREANYEWRENGVQAGVRIPLLLTNSRFNQQLTFGNFLGFNNVFDFKSDIPSDDRWFLDFGNQGAGNLLFNLFYVDYVLAHKMAKRDINPRWGGTARMDWITTPFGGDYKGGLSAFTGRLFLPGFFRHHSINFYAAYQKIRISLDQNDYWFNNRVLYPRGFGAATWENFYTLRSMYELTLWNADLALGPILNIQRIRGELFYDYGYGQTDVSNSDVGLQASGSRNYDSYGAEIMFDFNAFRIRALLSAGVRVVRVPQSNSTMVELVIGNLQI